eukprot:1405666-Amphidinium_carterae.1
MQSAIKLLSADLRTVRVWHRYPCRTVTWPLATGHWNNAVKSGRQPQRGSRWEVPDVGCWRELGPMLLLGTRQTCGPNGTLPLCFAPNSPDLICGFGYLASMGKLLNLR